MAAVLFHCIYTSVQTHPMPEAEVAQLVRHSRESNARHNLTGVLLHVGATFFQVLEGQPEDIDELYRKIQIDTRHHNITRIIFEPIARRYFADSNMSLLTMAPDELASVLEAHEAAETELLLAQLDEGRAKKLLRAFSDGRWRTPQTSPALPCGVVSA